MSSERITIRVPTSLSDRLRRRSRLKGQTESQFIREALDTCLKQQTEARSAYELACEAGLIGSVKGAPRDLSTNRRHLKDFGKRK